MGALNQSTRHLTDGNTNARVYRSHSDRVKRIVTESSPYLFLTCSEDGTVRQWDLRQPSSAYPPARGGRGFASHRAGHDDSNVPPPLISYKRYRLDLNTISCSGSQPHYIVLGGAHLHCFLHDRRMLGRDRLAERGASADVGSPSTDGDDKLMGEATRCVRRFAPGGRKKMRRHDNGHVTACKISDANPNEMIASWSGDHIYSFDLLRSPDARDPANQIVTKDIDGKGKGRVKESRERKRKRKQIPSDSSFEQMAPETSKSRLTSDVEASNADRDGDDDDIVLRLRYENGQSEDIPIEPTVSGAMAEQARESMFSEGQKRSLRIAKSLVKIRKLMFSLDTIPHEHEAQSPSPLSIHQSTFTSILGLCASMIPEMNDIDRSWLFPTRPSSHGAAVHATLRKNRDQARRFVLAAGTLARSLGARLQTAGTGESPVAKFFENSPAPPLEGHLSEPEKAFSYYFLKAILHWLKGGPGTLVKGFRKSNSSVRLPIPEDEADESAIERFLIPFLLEMATASRVPDVDTSRFERDESRNLFADESSALTAFSRAVKIPLQDMSRTTAFTNGDHEQGSDLTEVPNVRGQDRETARRYWAFRVGRGLLMKAGEGINFAFVDRAFGGLGAPRSTDEGRAQEDIDPNDEEQQIRSATIKSKRGGRQRIQEVLSEQGVTATTQSSEQAAAESTSSMPGNVESRVSEISIPAPGSESRAEQMQSENEAINGNGDHGLIGAPTDPEQSNDNDDDEVEAHVELDEDDDDGGMDDDEEDNEEDDDDEGSGSDIDIPLEDRHFFWQSLSDRASLREQVQNDIPVSAHTRVYRGHCNIKTIKDVNFFGLQDEYVVSGSDSGHFLIWDKKTSQLLNILEGDGEVVNVVQGLYPTQHRYSPRHSSSRKKSKADIRQATRTSPCSPFLALTAPSRSFPPTVSPSATPALAATSASLPTRAKCTLHYPASACAASAALAHNALPKSCPRTPRPTHKEPRSPSLRRLLPTTTKTRGSTKTSRTRRRPPAASRAAGGCTIVIRSRARTTSSARAAGTMRS